MRPTRRFFRTTTLTTTAVPVLAAQLEIGYAHFVGGAAAEIVIFRGHDLAHAAHAAVSAAAGDNSFNRADGGFDPRIRPGDLLITTGFAESGNNGTFTVVSATPSKIVVSGASLTTEAVGASVTMTARPPEYLRVGLAIGQILAQRYDHVFDRGLTVLTDSAAGDVSVTLFYNPLGDAV